MSVTTTFKFTPGELIDVEHMCIEGGMVLFATLNPSGGRGYIIQSTSGGRSFDVQVIESAVQPSKEE